MKIKLQATSNFKIIELNGVPTLLGQIVLPKAAKNIKVDYCTSNTAPFFTNIPLITILHDTSSMESSYLEILNKDQSTIKNLAMFIKLVVPRTLKKRQK
jgi:hypothetical protein